MAMNKFPRNWTLSFWDRQLFRYGTNKRRINILRKYGMKIGADCIVSSSMKVGSEPFLIKLGDRVRVTDDVVFITHQGATWVFRDKYKVTSFGSIQIGDNSFIGMRSIILSNVKIGKNCIIGAGSVVAKDCPDGGVFAGNPAKLLMTTEVFKEKMISLSIDLPINMSERRDVLTNIFAG